jgi:hypothetical protein
MFVTDVRFNFKRHLTSRKHKNKMKIEIEIKPELQNEKFICNYCNKNFAFKNSLTRHIKERCNGKKDNEIKIINEKNKNVNKMTGWIYCITNPLYKIDDTYKLGYTANKQTVELVKKALIQRYSTYYPNVECIDLFEVKQPLHAEKKLFELLKDYKYSNELIKADYELIIKPYLIDIKNLYNFT